MRVERTLLLAQAIRKHANTKDSSDNTTRKGRPRMKSPSFRVTNDRSSNHKDQCISSIFRSRLNVRRRIRDFLIVPTTVTLNKCLYHLRWKQLHSPIWIRVTGQRPNHSKHPQSTRTPNESFILTRNKIDHSTHRIFSVSFSCYVPFIFSLTTFTSSLSSRSLSLLLVAFRKFSPCMYS